jgi:glycosyltransferase involved in cell wall biosynthesis
VLQELASELAQMHLLVRSANGGKGAAVTDGLMYARELRFTHALQIDADGQHCLDDVPQFLARCIANPAALVCGQPCFDASMPRSRRIFRNLTHGMVWLNTLSFDIPDAMCGFRIYPLDPICSLILEDRPGMRMDFDIEILVRSHWREIPMIWVETAVRYPESGISNFRLVRDNALVTRAHLRLALGMLRRLPYLLTRRRQLVQSDA